MAPRIIRFHRIACILFLVAFAALAVNLVDSTTPEPTSEPTSEPTTEPEPESEPTTEPEPPVAEPRTKSPDPLDVVLAPVLLALLIVTGLFVLSVRTKRTFAETYSCKKRGKHHGDDPADFSAIKSKEEEENADDGDIFSLFDLEVIRHLDTFYNKPLDLLIIAGPSLLSIAFCPLTLFMYPIVAEAFWPVQYYPIEVPAINDAIACFLAPAGLVYAVTFGFVFQLALAKQVSIYEKITGELSLIDHILTITTKLDLPNKESALTIIRAVKAETIFMILQITNSEPDDFVNKPKEDVKVKIWTIIDELKTVQTTESGNQMRDHVNKLLIQEAIDNCMQLNSICSDRMGSFHTRIHPLKWAFLELLGYFSFFGVLLVNTKSAMLNLIICILTVFSISLLCYVVSDLDYPFSGFFRVNLTVLHDVLARIDVMFDMTRKGEKNVQYPTAWKKDHLKGKRADKNRTKSLIF